MRIGPTRPQPVDMLDDPVATQVRQPHGFYLRIERFAVAPKQTGSQLRGAPFDRDQAFAHAATSRSSIDRPVVARKAASSPSG
jgi:hypothetical protein